MEGFLGYVWKLKEVHDLRGLPIFLVPVLKVFLRF